ncbi:MAG: MscL family protein [Actinomycetota bacterium]
MRTFTHEFRKFAVRGNLAQVGVAFVLGLYFKEVIDKLTNGIVLAVAAAVFGKQNFSDIRFTINGSVFLIGDFLNAVVNLGLVLLVLFFVVRAWEAMLERMRTEPDEQDPTPDQLLLTEIRDLLAERPQA